MIEAITYIIKLLSDSAITFKFSLNLKFSFIISGPHISLSCLTVNFICCFVFLITLIIAKLSAATLLIFVLK